MKSKGSLTRSRQPITCPYPGPDKFSPCPQPNSWRSIVILSSYLSLGLPSDFFPSGFPNKTLYAPFFAPICATCPDHLILLDLINQIIFGEEYWSFNCSLFSFLHSPVTSSLWGPNILLSTLFSDTLSLSFSVNLSQQVSHPYKTPGKIIFLYILIFIFLESKLQDSLSWGTNSKAFEKLIIIASVLTPSSSESAITWQTVSKL